MTINSSMNNGDSDRWIRPTLAGVRGSCSPLILDRVSTAGRSLLPRQAGFLKNNASSRYKTLRDY